jgi:TPP-dependent pyruvate/acetoin dehydrogenase alpha subunit
VTGPDMKLNEIMAGGTPDPPQRSWQAAPVTACALLRPDDYMMPYHRGGHGRSGRMEPKRILAELMGKKTGPMGARGAPGRFDIGSWAEVDAGGSIPIAAGLGLSIRMRQKDQVVVCMFGEGPPNIGEWHEGVNLAAIWRAPVIFLCESNGYAETTRRDHTMLIERISERAAAYGIPGVTIDGNDVFAIYETVRTAVDRARRGEGPTLVEAITHRWLAIIQRILSTTAVTGRRKRWMAGRRNVRSRGPGRNWWGWVS